MGTFAEAAIPNYCLSFADQGKQTSVFYFRSQRTTLSLPFHFPVCSKQKEVVVFHCGIPETWRLKDMERETSKRGDMAT
jgi:hypothetical protein